MKAYLQDMVHASASPAHARNTVREYLQARILGVLQQCGAMIPLAFQGGTALRFLPGWPSPNLLLLNNALGQSGWDGGILDAHNWRNAVAGRLGDLDWDRIVADVSPFLDAHVNRDLLTRENLMKSLGADALTLGSTARG